MMVIRGKAEKVLRGISASPGIAIGRAYVLNKFHICVVRHAIQRSDVNREIDRFTKAVETTKERMVNTAKSNIKNLADNMSYILHPQIQLLNDPTVIGAAKKMIEKDSVNAEWALQETYDRVSARFKKIKDPYFLDRLHDFELVINRVMQVLTGTEHETLESVENPVIVFSHDLSPFDTIQMATRNILGFVTEVGGKTSHTGIIATSLQIPAVVGVQKITRNVLTGETVIVDSIDGKVIIRPSQEHFETYNKRRQQYLYYDQKFDSEEIGLPAKTMDGVEVSLKGNVESTRDIEVAIEQGAKGIGLFRSEFLFINSSSFPTEDQQFFEYKKAAETVSPNNAVIRTLDIGGDKIPWSYTETESNPALGLRAIRYCLSNKQVFVDQVRAILRASHYGKINIMYPMISGVEELLRANQILTKIQRNLTKENIPFDKDIKVGMMVEVPSAAIALNHFAPYIDFVSIGTNDLIQYLLAVDRGNEKVASMYEPLHPAVLRTLQMVIQLANKHDIPVSICGKMSADPIYAYLLMGMGNVADLSMEAHSIPKVAKFFRKVSAKDAKNDVDAIMKLGRVKDIKKYLLKKLSVHLEEGIISEVATPDPSKGPIL